MDEVPYIRSDKKNTEKGRNKMKGRTITLNQTMLCRRGFSVICKLDWMLFFGDLNWQ